LIFGPLVSSPWFTPVALRCRGIEGGQYLVEA
jgi:hypothetical protein